MPVPKKKTSKSKKNRRRKHLKLSVKSIVSCDKCKADKLPHTICGGCGS
ncbi:MAG: 50S ribosomal protein L32 [bacterium]